MLPRHGCGPRQRGRGTGPWPRQVRPARLLDGREKPAPALGAPARVAQLVAEACQRDGRHERPVARLSARPRSRRRRRAPPARGGLRRSRSIPRSGPARPICASSHCLRRRCGRFPVTAVRPLPVRGTAGPDQDRPRPSTSSASRSPCTRAARRATAGADAPPGPRPERRQRVAGGQQLRPGTPTARRGRCPSPPGAGGGPLQLARRRTERLSQDGQPGIGHACAPLPPRDFVARDRVQSGQRTQPLRQLPLAPPRGPPKPCEIRPEPPAPVIAHPGALPVPVWPLPGPLGGSSVRSTEPFRWSHALTTEADHQPDRTARDIDRHYAYCPGPPRTASPATCPRTTPAAG